MKRYRQPKQVPLTLKAQWGKMPDDDPDFIFSWGTGCSGADARLLNNVLCHERYRHPLLREMKPMPSLVEELKARGYDVTTLRFSIRKIEQPQPTPNHE